MCNTDIFFVYIYLNLLLHFSTFPLYTLSLSPPPLPLSFEKKNLLFRPTCFPDAITNKK